jgi:hypothetical protein
MSTSDADKSSAIAAIEKVIQALADVLDRLQALEKAVAASPPDLLQVTRREADVAAERFDQRALVAHLRAQNVLVQPMSQGARETLERLLGRLDTFVREDQAFHDQLDLAEVILGLAKDHSKEIQELTT